MLERDIQGKVVGYARSKGVLARKLNFGEGWPDYMLLFQGRIVFVEFKKPMTGKMRALQEFVAALLDKQGFEVGMCDDLNEGYWLVDLLVNP